MGRNAAAIVAQLQTLYEDEEQELMQAVQQVHDSRSAQRMALLRELEVVLRKPAGVLLFRVL
jgi:hypothetical protein